MTQDMTRDEIAALLPFLANGTLTGAELRAVQDWLARDPALADEARALAALRDAMQAEPVPQTAVELGLARLMRDIGRIDTPAPRSMRWQIAASLVLAAGLGATGGYLAQPGAEEVVYEQASGEAGLPQLTVAFVPGATMAQITELLRANGVTLVDGPSAIGLYRLAVPEGVDGFALAESLRMAVDLVESVDDPE
ncbi:anti-sigma factor family protein [Gemmobacter denitrificans]|uniref:Anti-sigma factor n=1 Tax=Gemmobacter denitrificans TaxID=3123040 RepID=A0ABU8BV14_9RHOB